MRRRGGIGNRSDIEYYICQLYPVISSYMTYMTPIGSIWPIIASIDMDLFDLTGRTAIVTGGTRGIGQQMAIALAEAGADIVLIQVFLYALNSSATH